MCDHRCQLFQIILLSYVTITGVRSFQKTNFPISRSTASTEEPINFRKPDRSSGCYGSDNSGITAIEKGAAKKDCTNGAEKGGKDQDLPQNRLCRYLFSPRLRLVCFLTIIFILCTILVPVVFFIDISVDTSVDTVDTYTYTVAQLRLASMVMVQVYTLLCPCLLVRYLSNLRLAINRMATAILKCCK